MNLGVGGLRRPCSWVPPPPAEKIVTTPLRVLARSFSLWKLCIFQMSSHTPSLALELFLVGGGGLTCKRTYPKFMFLLEFRPLYFENWKVDIFWKAKIKKYICVLGDQPPLTPTRFQRLCTPLMWTNIVFELSDAQWRRNDFQVEGQWRRHELESENNLSLN